MNTLIIPDMGNAEPAEIIEIFIAAGDTVEQEQSTIVLESEKATIEVPATSSGKIEKLLVKVGDKIGSGDAYAEISATEESKKAAEPKTEQKAEEAKPVKDDNAEEDKTAEAKTTAKPEQPEQVQESAAQTVKTNTSIELSESSEKVYAGPAVRKLARELGVSLEQVPATGLRGRIQKEDVQDYVKNSLQADNRPLTGVMPQQPEIDFSQFGSVSREPLNNIKRATAKAMSLANLLVPQVTHFELVDITELEDFRKQQNQHYKEQGIKFTIVPFVMKALAQCLLDFPRFNSSLSADGEELILKEYVNIGVAVDTPKGLLVPVIKDVNQKSITQITQELQDTAERTRQNKLSLTEMQGGCMSVSSLGGIGGTAFTPIVNPPEVAILGLSKASIQPVWNGQEFVPRLMLPLSLSYDHRVVDGAEAARFSQKLQSYLQDLRHLLM